MKDELYKAFTGSEIEVLLLKDELEANGISSMARDGFSSGLRAGFYGGSPSSVDLYISDSDKDLAAPIIEEFLKNREEPKEQNMT